MDIRVTAAELARRWGKTPMAVTHATNKGRITKGPDGRYPLQESLQILQDTARDRRSRPAEERVHTGAGLRPGRKPGRPAEGEREAEAANAIDMAINDPQQFMRTTSLAEAARVERAAMAIARVQLVERNQREWCTVEDVNEVFTGIASRVRQRILSVPGSIASLVAPHDPAKAERLIAEALNEALADLSAGEIAREAQGRREQRQLDKSRSRAKRSEEA